jgi:hypothetical protein
VDRAEKEAVEIQGFGCTRRMLQLIGVEQRNCPGRQHPIALTKVAELA